ncbi:MAG TPA: hypothetical protein VG734_20200 [Lacunisphaera sp.]|nr:hypothetical protein [Lacunisphaera sp.]
MPPTPDPEDISPPFSAKEREQIKKILEEAEIDPADYFTLPQKPSPNEPGKNVNPNIPEGRTKENYNGQKGDGSFKRMDFPWQPQCDVAFAVVVSEVWTPPPAGLAAKFRLWAAFACVRAVLICRRNKKCRRPIPLGCESTWEIKFANGEVYARARFVFVCAET